jgi:hypothetical protein
VFFPQFRIGLVEDTGGNQGQKADYDKGGVENRQKRFSGGRRRPGVMGGETT